MQQTAHMSHHVAGTWSGIWAIFRQPIWIDAISESISFIHWVVPDPFLAGALSFTVSSICITSESGCLLTGGISVPWFRVWHLEIQTFRELDYCCTCSNICSPAAECRDDLQSQDADVARQEASMAVLQHPSPAPLLHDAGLVPLPTLRLLLFAQRKRTWFFIGSHKKFCPWLEAFFSVSIA